MSIFDIFKKKKNPKSVSTEEIYLQEILDDFSKHDYLGKAADADHKAKAAVKAKEFDKAWGLYHEQKLFYMQHANRSGFTKRQVLALDSQVHEDLANILRIENKNDDALVHILYWVIANNDMPIKRHQQKLTAYFNRCKFGNTSTEEAINFATSNISNPDFVVAQSKVAEWRSRG
jgi:hypothetical protein